MIYLKESIVLDFGFRERNNSGDLQMENEIISKIKEIIKLNIGYVEMGIYNLMRIWKSWEWIQLHISV